MSRYRGRFAPTPSGPLHAGSIVAALASWLDARAHEGTWLIRIEDTDTPRCVPGADEVILTQLQALGLHSDEPVIWQSQRSAHYRSALQHLQATALVYPCHCSRKDIERTLEAQGLSRPRHAMAVYPRTCRPAGQQPLLKGPPGKSHAHQPTAWRMALPEALSIEWIDRGLGTQSQDLTAEVGDFILRRADGLWAYQLAVVVDDGLQGITDVVRGEDLADNTPRQIHLQRALALPTPRYLHTPLVRAGDGQKLSKQTGAAAIDIKEPLATLKQAAQVLGLDVPWPDAARDSVGDWLARATQAWASTKRHDTSPTRLPSAPF